MDENNWLKAGLLALAGFGFLAILGVALTAGDDIEGETWVVEDLVVEGTAASPISGTELSAHFADGSLNGVAGCNSYFASYEVDGDALAIGPAGSTMAFCSAPEGIMEQEIAYLTVLGAVDSFARDGDKLTLISNGVVVLTFAAAESE